MERPLDRLNEHARSLAEDTLELMDRAYDPAMGLLWKDAGDPKAADTGPRHDVRSSAYYAAGLLVRQGPGDLDRACAVLGRVIDNQYDAPGELFHGTFKRSPQDLLPVPSPRPWKSLDPGFLRDLAQKAAVMDPRQRQALLASEQGALLPWGRYDPNWREFIGCTFAFLLAEFEAILPPEVVARIDRSAQVAVEASIERRRHPVVPMQTNIELMHGFIADFFGSRFHRPGWQTHAEHEAEAVSKAFRRYGTFSEYNSPTYYGIDLWALGFWRRYSPSETIRRLGHELETGLWEDIASLYHPELRNLCGPFTRSYGMDMQDYVTPTGLYLWLELGRAAPLPDPGRPRPDQDLPYPQIWDYFYGPMVAVMGTALPPKVRSLLTRPLEPRTIRKTFVEDGAVCTATAFLAEGMMWGGLKGSRSTSGQLHPATIAWKDEEGRSFSLRVSRRLPGEFWNNALAGVIFRAEVSKDRLEIGVDLNRTEPVEVFFEIRGEGLDPSQISAAGWRLPGLPLSVSTDADQDPRVERWAHSMEISYRFSPSAEGADLSKSIRFTLSRADRGSSGGGEAEPSPPL